MDKTDNEQESELAQVLKMESGRFVNAETLALSALKRAITRGTLVPGQEIDEEAVAGYLSISRMPVRQALGILESEGLVKRNYRRGVVVTKLSHSEIEEIYHIKATLESLAIGRAIPNYNEGHLQGLRGLLHQLDGMREDPSEFTETNKDFHLMLYEPSGWHQLIKLIGQLRDNTARYIRIADSVVYQARAADTDCSHGKILEACEARDVGRAERLMREHILLGMEVLLRVLQ